MSQSRKSVVYQALKEAGAEFSKHYRDYTTEELEAAYASLDSAPPLPEEPRPVVPPHDSEVAELREQIGQLSAMLGKLAQVVTTPRPEPVNEVKREPDIPKQPEPKLVGGLDPLEHAGITQNTHKPGEPIRVDEHGNQWFRNEVNKPGYPRARGRRVHRSMDSGSTEETIRVGNYTETFEIPGDPKNAKPIEIRVTLPSYQTGIYRPRGMPFKIHTYQGVRGFDWDDVNRFYGAADLVPSTVKHCYVSSDLCYDITTTIRAIEDEYRERVLKKESVR